jgi:tRNA(adenine34) deaminase
MLGVCGRQRKRYSLPVRCAARPQAVKVLRIRASNVHWAVPAGPGRVRLLAPPPVIPRAAAHNVSLNTPANDEQYMREALRLADEAEWSGEVPVGAVVVAGGQIVGRGANATISQNDPTAHAEIISLREAARKLGNYRLLDSTLYVTMEPCAMCAGALVAARVSRLVFGSRDLRFGAVRSKFRLADSDLLNHRIEIVEGVLAAECLQRLQRFFEQRR